MRGILITSILSFGLYFETANAHFKIGTYVGNNNCQIEIQNVVFENDLHHPLNERVVVKFKIADIEQTAELRHLPIVDVDAVSVRPKREVLSAVFPESGGAAAMELFMNENGPFRFVYVKDVYRQPAANLRYECGELQYKE